MYQEALHEIFIIKTYNIKLLQISLEPFFTFQCFQNPNLEIVFVCILENLILSTFLSNYKQKFIILYN